MENLASNVPSMLPPSIGELTAAVTDKANDLASQALPALTVSPDSVQQKPAEAHAAAAIDQAEASVASAVVSGTAAEKIAAKSAELVCAELRKNGGNMWQQASNAIIEQINNPDIMKNFSKSISDAVIENMSKSLTEAIEKDSGVAAAMMVDVIDSIGKLNVYKYQNEIKQYTRGKSVGALSAAVNQQTQPLVPPPLPESNAAAHADATEKPAVAQLTQEVPNDGVKAAGGRKIHRYSGGAIYSFQPELQFLKTLVHKSRKLKQKRCSTKKNKQRSRRLRK